MALTKQQKAERAKDYRLRRVYGITFEEYLRLLSVQAGSCAICKRQPREGKGLHVDHKHQRRDRYLRGNEKRSSVRGLLCWVCNTAIGKFRDNSTKMRAAADYIDNPPAKKVIT